MRFFDVRRLHVVQRLVCAGVVSAAVLWGSVAASSLNVSPVRLELAPGQSSGTIEVNNRGDRPAILQAQLFEWNQSIGAEDQYLPTRALVVTPAVFTVPPGERQVVRVGVRQAAPDAPDERAYRLLMKEVPPAEEATGPGLRIALQINLPVFIAPGQPVRTESQWTATRLSSDTLKLSVENTGNTHLQITQLNLSSGDGALGLTDSAPSLMYVLPGRAQAWTLTTRRPLPETGQTITVRADTNHGDRRDQLTLGS